MSLTPDYSAAAWDPCENPHTHAVLDSATRVDLNRSTPFDLPVPPSPVPPFTSRYPDPQKAEMRYAPYYARTADKPNPTAGTIADDFEYPEDSLEDYEAFADERDAGTDADEGDDERSASEAEADSEMNDEDLEGEPDAARLRGFVSSYFSRSPSPSSRSASSSSSGSEADPNPPADFFPATRKGQQRRVMLVEASLQVREAEYRRLSAKKRSLKRKIAKLRVEKDVAERVVSLMNLVGSNDLVEGEGEGEEMGCEEYERGRRMTRGHRRSRSRIVVEQPVVVEEEEVQEQDRGSVSRGRPKDNFDWRRFAITNLARMREEGWIDELMEE